MGRGKRTKTFDPFDLDDRLERAEKVYTGWIVVMVGRTKITAYHKDTGKRLVQPQTVPGFNALENDIESHNENL